MELAIHLSMKPVTLKDNESELAPHVKEVIKKLIIAGKDPIEELRQCRWYVQRQIGDIYKRFGKKSWKVRNTNPRRAGTIAYLTYIDDNTSKILGILTEKKINNSLRLDL